FFLKQKSRLSAIFCSVFHLFIVAPPPSQSSGRPAASLSVVPCPEASRTKMSALQPKKNYRCVPALQQIYTGGPFVVASDGSFIACACGESIKIVDSVDFSIKGSIEEDNNEAVTALTLSPNDKLLFSAGHSRQIRVWNLSTLKCERSWKGHDGPVMTMACHASGGLLATAGSDRKVLVWDVDGHFCTHYFKGHKGVVTCIMFHPDSTQSLLFSGSDDATVRVWDLLTKKCVATLDKHFSTVTSMAVSEDGRTLLTAGRDKVVNVWDLNDFTCKTTVLAYEVLEALSIIRSGTLFSSFLDALNQRHGKGTSDSSGINFATVGERGIVRLWNSERATCLYEHKYSDVTVTSDIDDDQSRRGLTGVVALPNDLGLLSITADQQFLFYSPTSEGELVLNKRLVGYNEEILDMKFLGEEENFLAVATNLEQVRVYDLASMSCSYVLSGHAEIVLCLDTCTLSCGRILVATGSKDNTVRLWDSGSRKCVGIGKGHMGAIGAVAFSKKEKNFLISGSSDRTIKVWSFDGISYDGDQPTSLKAKAVVAAHDKDINSLAVAPNDRLVCTGSQDRTARVWRLPDLVSVVEFKGHKRGIWSVEFSPVDPCVITASGDKTIKIWSIADGTCKMTFEGHTSSVLRASFLTRGTQFVSSGADGLVKLWTVRTNECIATYDQHEDKVWALAIGKKTELFATGGGDAVVNLWHDSTASDKEDAFREEEERILKGQTLENAIMDKDYSKAIQLAFELDRPRKLFELFSELCRKREAGGTNHMEKAVCTLGKEQLRLLFEYAREWNTKPKMCHIAQLVLFQVFSNISPSTILEIKGINEVLEGLIPYTQRHFTRIDRAVRSTYLVDYSLVGMGAVDADVDAKDGGEALVETGVSKKRKSSTKSSRIKSKKVKTVAPDSISLEA
ncbi:Protein TORMOZ EMBRYO DEFECTIVE, partial [Linum grandiflorum]